ncbi:hypothetical protein [Stutzerimonas stutzeri]|uniref:hypothetical protein n=1 Tax=Stutzerimonas stutzeri TaxID=316 RepID=UPI00210D7E4B|nr:hypothetical protein [Stutzerimonas stutzeri]MCQ4320473.1 hypothetical protein [Stutzerimonas stutzeri]
MRVVGEAETGSGETPLRADLIELAIDLRGVLRRLVQLFQAALERSATARRSRRVGLEASSSWPGKAWRCAG